MGSSKIHLLAYIETKESSYVLGFIVKCLDGVLFAQSAILKNTIRKEIRKDQEKLLLKNPRAFLMVLRKEMVNGVGRCYYKITEFNSL